MKEKKEIPGEYTGEKPGTQTTGRTKEHAEKAAPGKRVAPFTFKERTLYDILKKVLGKVRFGITDDLFDLGLDDEGIRTLVAEAAQQGIEVTAEDVREYRTIGKIVKGTDSVCRWYGEKDPDSDRVSDKPILVLVHGVTPEGFYMSVLEGLEDRFFVLDIEPIVEHFQYAFDGERIPEVVDFYDDMIRYYLPEGRQVYGFIGHSFGGDLAYRLAVRWAEENGVRPFVYMIDTYMRVYDADHYEEYKQALLNRFDPKTRIQADAYMKVCAYCFDVAKELGDGKALPPYDGPVRLFSATNVKEEPTLAAVLPVKAVMHGENPNVKAWRNLASNITVDYVDGDHLTIMTAPKFKEILFRRMDWDLAKTGYRHPRKD